MASMSAPFDAQFMDGMIVHHLGAIAMANDTLSKAEKPEIKTFDAVACGLGEVGS